MTSEAAPEGGAMRGEGALDGSPMTEWEISGSSESVEEGLLRIGLSEPVSTMDIHKTSSEYMIPLNIYERLFDVWVDEDGVAWLVDGLAEDYSVENGGQTYRFTLRDDAYFSDGSKVKASDVAFSFARMLTLPGSLQTDFADIIYGADEVMGTPGKIPEGIRVLDDRHLEITLSEPFEGYLYELASPSCSVLSESFVTRAGDDYGSGVEQTMGSGPYAVTEYSEQKIRLERNPYYHCLEGESLSVRKVEMIVLPPALMAQAFLEGGLDILDTGLINPDAEEIIIHSDRWKDRIVKRSRVDIKYVMMNLDSPGLEDIRLRRAIQMAVNRQDLLDTLYGGEGSLVDGIFPKGLFGFSEENQGWLKYDLEEAKRLIREVPDVDKIHLELAANSQSNTRTLTALEMIRQDLEEAGLDVIIVSYDEKTLMYLRRNGSLMMYSGEWTADYDDPDNFIYTFFGSSEKTHSRSSHYDDPTVFSRISKARGIQNRKARLAEYARLEKILVQDNAVWIPLYSTGHQFVLGDRTASFSPFWAGWSSMYFRDVVLKENNETKSAQGSSR